MKESRQVRRANERRNAKVSNYSQSVRAAQRGGASSERVHRNRRHRDDGLDYFDRR